MLIHNKDDIEFVTEFPCFLGHPVCLSFGITLDTVLYQFLKTGRSIRTNLGRDQFLKFLGFSLYFPSYYLNSFFKIEILDSMIFNFIIAIKS